MKLLPVVRPYATLPPFPNGWYVVGFSRKLKPGDIVTKTFAGREVVLFRTAKGVPSLMDAYCPHLGAHFGHGGTVQGETINCPFHAFCFDTQGACVSTGSYGTKPPPKAKAQTWPLRELNGLLLAYHDCQGLEPAWEVPALDFTGWTPLRSATWKIRTHPQETSENSADLGHFTAIHKYQAVKLSAGTTEGPLFRTQLSFERPGGLFNRSQKRLTMQSDICVYGLGYSVVETHIAAVGLTTRQFVLSTPLDGAHVQLSIAFSVKHITHRARIHPLLALLPYSLVNRLVSRVGLSTYIHDVNQDFKIWSNKKYLHPPALAEGDGPVGKYRQWARQFYPEFSEPQQGRVTSIVA